jgi:hypothetical protein
LSSDSLRDKETVLNESKKKTVDWLHRIILPCNEVTRVLSDPPKNRLSTRERIALRAHLAVCVWCSRYQHQLKRLRLTLHHHPAHAEAPEPTGLSPEARGRIRRSLGGHET